ncbi:hypothetical protein [Henriciella pelagia]|jgi:hypothetical protein|uniref:Uncharacterized protein n=1 Tax=Henriciella pelagia TaxID=1977912 RepID=A0ABQ1JUM0_9PROT|nr:hypothetical protein [Henriciella pelagia]GGB78527.1 hypothetical protein GCM10011503_29190 [Henriciella pelagia]
MLNDLISTTAKTTGLDEASARQALGVLFNTAERQGAPLIEKVFSRMPGARTLSATTGAQTGAATGTIARLIEQTPGGRQHVSLAMFSKLHEIGLGHKQIGQLMGCVGSYMESTYDIRGIGHLGDLVVADPAAAEERKAAVA